MRRSSSPRLKPKRSESAVILTLTLSAALLASGIVLLDAAGPAHESVKARLLARDDDFGANYLPLLDGIVTERFIHTGIGYLVLAAAFAGLAIASRIGPRWSVVALGVLCIVGTIGVLFLTVARAATDLPVGSSDYDRLMDWLEAAAPAWFAPTETVPALATIFGLPAVGALLIHRHFRNAGTFERHTRANAPVPFG